MSKKSFICITENLVFKNKWIELYDDIVIKPDGEKGSYIRLTYHNNPPGVVVIPQLPDGRVLLIKVNRYAIGKESLEFPRGGGNIDETLDVAGARELFQETGLSVEKFKFLGYHYPDTAIMMTKAGVLLAELKEGDETILNINTNEAINGAQFVRVNELWEMVAKGKINDGFTLGALALLQAKKNGGNS